MLKGLRLDDSAPWKQRFRTSRIVWTMLADGEPTRGLVASNLSGVVQLYAWDVPTGKLRQLTNRPQGQVSGRISPDGCFVYYHEDSAGNEIGHVVRVPFEGGHPEDITPDMPPYPAWGLHISRTGNLLALVSASAEGFLVSLIESTSAGTLSPPRPVHHSASIIRGLSLSSRGEMVVLTSTTRSRHLKTHLLALDTQTGQSVATVDDGPERSVRAGAFSPVPGDERLLATTDRSGVARPFIWNPRTGERRELAISDLEGEVTTDGWSPDGQQILLKQFSQAVEKLSLYDLASQTRTALSLSGGSLGAGAYFGPGNEIFVHWSDSTHPVSLIACHRATGEQTRTVLSAGEAPAGHRWRSITFPSSDGQQIQGWLGLPDGQGPFPTMLMTHGGPAAVQTERFSPISQSWLDAGFAFLSINYHGSTTFGRAFEQSIWGDLGHWEIEDMVAARTWLIEQGIAQPQAIFLTGWSYGGYLTLLGLGKRPDLWAGGLAGTAVADWAVQYEDSAETLKGVERALFGGTPEEYPERYAASSPITYAADVRAPLLIIQGRHDTRTPARPVEMYEKKMRELGKEIEVVWFDAGHLGSVTRVERSIAHQEVMLRFASRILDQG